MPPHSPKDGRRVVNPVRIRAMGGERKRKILGDGGRRCPSSSHDRGGVMSPRRTLGRDVRKKGRRCQTAVMRCRRSTGRRLKLVSLLKKGRRDLGKGRGSTRKNVIFSNSLWTNSEYPNLLKNMFIWSL